MACNRGRGGGGGAYNRNIRWLVTGGLGLITGILDDL